MGTPLNDTNFSIYILAGDILQSQKKKKNQYQATI